LKDDVPIAWLRFGDVIRLNADRGAQERELLGQADVRPAGRRIRADGDDTLETRCLGAGDDVRQVLDEARIVQMRVRVDHGTCPNGNESWDIDYRPIRKATSTKYKTNTTSPSAIRIMETMPRM